MSYKWQEMTIGQLATGIEDAEINAMNVLNEIVAKFREDFDLNILGISVIVKYEEVGKPPRVVDVDFNVPVRRGVI